LFVASVLALSFVAMARRIRAEYPKSDDDANPSQAEG
jgi:hypothetical protein